MSPTICKNCESALPRAGRFCPTCGQSVKEITHPWLQAFSELLRELLDIDGRMLVSLRMLLTRPGFLSHEYIRDRRTSYTS